MADLAVSCVISGVALDIAAEPYSLWRPGVEPGMVQRDRVVVTSPWTDDEFLVGSTLRMRETLWRVKVKSASIAALATAVQVLNDAFTQDTFTITLTVDGTVLQWDCEAASEYGVRDGELDPLGLMHSWQLLVYNVPTKSNALQGPF